MKKVVYSCITGDYDDIPVYEYVDKSWKYVLFTDSEKLLQHKKIKNWEIRPLYFNKLDNVKNARWHKVNPHILFPEYDYSLWLDANIIIKNDNIFKKCEKYIKNSTLIAVPLHPKRSCIYKEADTIKESKIDYAKTVNKEMKFLKESGYPKDNGLSETCILFRKHNLIAQMLNLWWSMIEKYSKRDQLSFDFAAWKYDIKKIPLYKTKGKHRKCADFTFIYKTSHNQDKITNNSNFIKSFFKKIGIA